MIELSTRFNFKKVESKWCQYWEKKQVFRGLPNKKEEAYSIVIPPPNVTGILHMGHALNNTLQDILIRYKRMKGYETCWMPGTDHAGIATQNVVEKQLAKEGKTRHDIGREEMLRRLWAWKQEYGETIINQLKKIGASCDWTRTRFTMDDDYSEAVKEVFVRLYEKGLIYQGKYIINWCPRCQTALSDEEAEYREQQGALYYIRYPFKDNDNQYVVVATTRPETMLGDTAVAVNPHDKRYKNLIGKILILPIIEREIQIISDEFVDPEFGTGAVKVTPAHDPNDFLMGQRHNLEFVNIMHPDGRMNEQAGELRDQDRFEAREAILEILKNLKLLEKVLPHTHAVGHCYRCHTIVEPYLSKQWFVKMKPLAEPAIKVVQEGKVKFYPDRWSKVYLNWMENIRDWCISRQIWWGHRIPVWYCKDCPEGENLIVDRKKPKKCPKCNGKHLEQDEDVLDTWFSSWLWPFATFGWPQETKDLAFFYPTNSLFTASEIIFFWVARMIMAGLEFMNDIPFSDVYIHGTVRDAKGRKMSKSLGNALDPLEIVEEYGADALRFSLIINSGLDLYISKEKFEIGRNFANKIWNASRLVLMNVSLENRQVDLARDLDWEKIDLPSKWIISRFHFTLKNVDRAIEQYRFSEAENLIYEFFWGNFCDWYLEIIKNKFHDENIAKIAFSILENSLRLMCPFLPFVTEEVWEKMDIAEGPLSKQSWPQVNEKLIDEKALKKMQTLIDMTTGIRNLRAEWNIKRHQKVDCLFASNNQNQLDLIKMNEEMLQALCKIKNITLEKQVPKTKNSATGIVKDIKFCLPLGDIIDVEKEKARIENEIISLEKAIKATEQRLKNKAFLKKAPQDIVKKDKERLEQMKAKTKGLKEAIKNLD